MKLSKVLGLQDARSTRGVLARGKPNYGGPGNAPNPGKKPKAFNLQKAAEKRIRNLQKGKVS